MKYLIMLLLASSLSLAESGVKIHGLNIGYGNDGVTSTGVGIAYKDFYADYFILPDESTTFSLSRSFKYDFAALNFGSYVGVTDINNTYFNGYNLGTEYKMYFQPYFRIFDIIEISAIQDGAKLSFIITR
jgi:hypothetical protein